MCTIVTNLAILALAIVMGTLAGLGVGSLIDSADPPHAAAEAAQEALGKALAAPDLPTARKHAGNARGHVRRLETCH